MKSHLWIPVAAVSFCIAACDQKDAVAEKLKEATQHAADSAKGAIDDTKKAADEATAKAKELADEATTKAKETAAAAAKLTEEKKKELEDAARKAAESVTPVLPPAPAPTEAP